jgi:predicted nucleic acid-binding protein
MSQSAKRGYRPTPSKRRSKPGLPSCQFVLALEAVHAHRLPFWDAMLWASAQRGGVSHMLSEDFQDGFELQDVTFINPFNPEKIN